MNGIIYCRVSTKEQTEGTSLDSQKQACLEYAVKKNIHILRVFTEQGESAKFADRTELVKLIDFCQKERGQVHALIVWKIDRFARNVVDHFQIKSLLGKHGVTVHSVTEPIDSKPEGQLMETMLAGFAQFDNDIRAVRCVEGMKRKIEDGLYPWRPPLGYSSAARGRAKKTQPDTTDPERFSIIKEGWRRLLSGAYTKADILRYFGANGLTTRGGKRISAQFIDRLFSNKYYAGILVNPWTNEEVHGKHLPMVTPEEYCRVQAIFRGRSRSTPHQRLSPDFPLRALLRCPACLRPLTGSWSRGRSKKYPYYSCYFKQCERYGKCIPRSHLESEFSRRVARLAPRPVLIPRIEARIADIIEKAGEKVRASADRYRLRLRQLERENNQLIEMRRKELIGDDEFIRDHNRLADEIASLHGLIHEKESAKRLGKDAVGSVLRFLADIPKTLENMPSQARQRFQQIIFPEGLVAGRIGTAKNSPIFRIIGDLQRDKSTEVHRSLAIWNRGLDQFAKIFEALQALKGEAKPENELVPNEAR
jgi:site-specific DNA recombinase